MGGAFPGCFGATPPIKQNVNFFSTAGNNDVAPEGKERIFLGFPHCRAALDLKKDQNYLIMGASKDIHVDRRDNLYVSMLVWVPGGRPLTSVILLDLLTLAQAA